jgi:hypothetical protein
VRDIASANIIEGAVFEHDDYNVFNLREDLWHQDLHGPYNLDSGRTEEWHRSS